VFFEVVLRRKIYVLHLFSQVLMILCNLLSTVNYHEGDLNKVPSTLASKERKHFYLVTVIKSQLAPFSDQVVQIL